MPGTGAAVMCGYASLGALRRPAGDARQERKAYWSTRKTLHARAIMSKRDQYHAPKQRERLVERKDLRQRLEETIRKSKDGKLVVKTVDAQPNSKTTDHRETILRTAISSYKGDGDCTEAA